MSTLSHPHARRPVMPDVLAAIAPSVVALILGNVATFPNLPWYATLAKPGFTPPNWLFGPAWTTLYILMAVAVFRVLRRPSGTPGRAPALKLFLVQMGVNAAWSWAFFAAHSPLAGIAVIAVLDVLVLATAVLFWRIDRVAALCLVPYLCWIGYATALVVAVWQLNG